MKIYTRTGDGGKTGLFGGARVDKDNIRVECYGTFDEVNAFVGLLRTKLPSDHAWQGRLHDIQIELMNTMSLLATPPEAARSNTLPLPAEAAESCERWIDELEAAAGPSEFFLLPGGTEIAALCHVIRTLVRRGERLLVRLGRETEIDASVFSFINRLSDLFFALSRAELSSAGIEEERLRSFAWKKRGGG
ncbi:ATP:cob(I)alamin adenosyltransferase [Prosthecochloris sp. GSB1]|uniref:cob(I)yrinic acid a,c-diamide adenosyltransferase n=1 Tax=Prosthecochloris sp. GSB1 TaxID=281093 RepID=UPI000B8CAF04|nr:cob(I)yrinic acid a,c-diamide adenosyltransferase [Prosthecochloris sp. GSB1]ASQ89808.1 ATP:cob(I)alamin adenosyltransferase [Prosthecochloris sp. GSB1]